MDHSSHSCLVYDQGLFVEIAATLSKSFGKVYYFMPWVSAFPKSNSLLVGKGMPNVERVDDIWNVNPDLWVFPDVYDGGLQIHLEELGKRVWGSRMGEELELYRPESKHFLKSTGFSVGKYGVVCGLDALRKALKAKDNVWVKISRTRGDMETFYSSNYKNIEPRLDELEHVLGAKKKNMKFVVEASIEDAVEIGYDGYSIDGKFPGSAMVGIEVKNKGYLGHFQKSSDMPEQIQKINNMMAPALKEFGYKNFFTIEARITKDGTPWVIDPCCRFGSPPGELVQLMYTNLADIFWHGAEGELIDPVPAGEWGAELLIHSSWADKNWLAVHFPESIRDSIKFRNFTIIDGEYYIVPQSVGLSEIGAIVAVGKTSEEVSDKVQKLAAQVEGYVLDVFPDSLQEADKEIAKLKEYGIEL